MKRTEEYRIRPIAHIRSDFQEKFGVPRQGGLAGTRAQIVFEPDMRIPEAVRGLEEFSHIWLLWRFSENGDAPWHPTVRPPALGGNVRKGVFATRSPFRPNGIGLSCVELERVEASGPEGPVLHVIGADLVDGTPILDIKPYVPYADCRPDASGSFSGRNGRPLLAVEIPEEVRAALPAEKAAALEEILAQDPRPSYQDDPERVYGFRYAGRNIRFTVNGTCLKVLSAEEVSGPRG